MIAIGAEMDDPIAADGMPEDVAALYAHANLRGAKYRDYSASRREYRAQVRYRAAKARLEEELGAQASAEEAERATLAAEAMSLSQDASMVEPLGLRPQHTATRRAASDRLEAARRAEAAARAAVQTLREQREMAEAHESARVKEQVYRDAEQRRRRLAGPQPGRDAGAAGSEMGSATDSSAANPEEDLVAVPWFASAEPGRSVPARTEVSRENPAHAVPAWITASPLTADEAQEMAPLRTAEGASPQAGETLLDSQERVASRWFALRGLFASAGAGTPALQAQRAGDGRLRVMAVFSLAGGVGKTSLVATLARALTAQGETVQLAETTTQGLLPFYFGLSELERGAERSIAPHAGAGEPVSLAAYEVAAAREDARQEKLVEELLRAGEKSQRLLLEVAPDSLWLLRRMADLRPVVVVPLAPDMSSVVSLQAVERTFRGITDSDGRHLQPHYVLNHFDASLPLHLDIREVFRRKLGERLLPVSIRRSPAVSEALAEGMTVMEYAPEAPVARDFTEVALWLQGVAPVRGVQWSGR